MFTFTLIPISIEVTLVVIIFITLFSWEFCLLQLFAIIVYIIATYILTERRAKLFKAMTMADQNYNQKATDSLLNFETVKYFNAEAHEEERFEKALIAYKIENVKVSKSLVSLNVAQSFVISVGLLAILLLASYYTDIGIFSIGTFVMFNQYNMQVYTQLGFLGSIWRWIRQSMVDVE